MQPFQQRVVDEKKELDDKLSKLIPFLISETFKAVPPAEQARLIKQSDIMKEYSEVLGERIAEFTDVKAA